MEIGYVALFTAFTAGVISFLSPCVLTVLPTYIAFLGGTGRSAHYPQIQQLWVNIAIFLSGFIIVFLIFGACAGYLGQALHDYQHIIGKIGAVFIIIMGLQLSGLISFTMSRRKVQLGLPSDTGPLGIFLLGVASTAAWSPCNGPLLAPLLVYASTSPSLVKGISLFLVYALGFCLPFTLLAVTLNRYLFRIHRFSRQLHRVQHIAGILLALGGILLFFDLLS